MNIKMRPKIYCLAALLIAILALATLQHVRAADPQNVRQENVRRGDVAGGFYPADRKALSAMMNDMLAHASRPAINGPILAVVAPHAGYQFSGPVDAYSCPAL